MSPFGYTRTYSSQLTNVRFTPECGLKWLCRGMSAYDPKRTLRRYQYDGFSGADDCPPTLHELVRFAMLW